MKTGTLEVINKLWNFRKETGHPLFLRLDAGANVHLLFPENESTKAIKDFISAELLPHTQKRSSKRCDEILICWKMEDGRWKF